MAGDQLKLVGAITEGSGVVNEDTFGYLGSNNDVTAAWVFDGVTGINDRNYLPGGTDAAWLVATAHNHLLSLAKLDLPLHEIISRLVSALIEDWKVATENLNLPENYDPPAACLILAKRYGNNWQAVRLGDSCLLANCADGTTRNLVASPNKDFDTWLTNEVTKRRDSGATNIAALLAEFHPQLQARRKLRNTSVGCGILEANLSALDFAEYLELGHLDDLLICTDGYFRAVDCYGLHDKVGLLMTDVSVKHVLQSIRATEAADPSCERYPRFKPADDVTAIRLSVEK